MNKKTKKGLTAQAGILIAFGELFLKSPPVQEFFKKKLIQNISFFLKKADLDFKIYSFRERIFIETVNLKKAGKIIKNVFGIAWYSEALFFEKDGLKEVSNFVSKNYQEWIKKEETFAIRLKKGSGIKDSGTRASAKGPKVKEKNLFSHPSSSIRARDEVSSSKKIIEKIAEKIERKVDLTKPKKEIFIETRKQGWYLYFKKKKGTGGLPVGTSGKVLTLISGGIDSPVASYLTAKRGTENVWLHFHSFPLVSRKSIEKTKELTEVFLKFQPKLKIYFIPFSKIQMEIKAKILPKYRILLYRRTMLKIAEQMAKKENCYALATGESLGQVSSQTLPNIQITQDSVSLPILRPLIAMDKEEIIKLAKKIKTYQISIKPQEDCCTLFTPKHATAQGKLAEIKKMERKLDLKKLIKDISKEIEIWRNK